MDRFQRGRRLRLVAGWPGERGPGDPLLDGGRGLRGGRLRGCSVLLSHPLTTGSLPCGGRRERGGGRGLRDGRRSRARRG